MDLDGLHLDDLQTLWITTMHLAGVEDQQIKDMFDDIGNINNNINGWIMTTNEQEDTKGASSINHILQHICEIKPLLINIEACQRPKHVINIIIKRQIRQQRNFWIKSDGRITTNLAQGKIHTDDLDNIMINSFIYMLHNNGRNSINAVGPTTPEGQQRFWDDLSGQELDREKVRQARQ